MSGNGTNVGTIYGGIEFNNRDFKGVLRESKAEAARAMLEMERSTRIKVDKTEWKQLTGQLKDLKGRAQEARLALLNTPAGSEQAKQLRSQLKQTEARVRLLKNATEPYRKELERVAAAEARVSQEARKMTAEHGRTATQAKELTAILGTMGGPVGRVGQAGAFGGFYAAAGAASVLGIGSLVMLGKKSIEADMRMDSLRRGLIQVMGSADAARAELVKLDEVAKLPGLGLEEAEEGSLKLQAVGESAKEARDIMMSFGNALAVVGKGKEELAAVEEQIMQMLSKGKVMTEDIRIIRSYVPQLSEAMRNAFGTANAEEIAKMGVSAKEFVNGIVAELAKLSKMTGGVKNAFENMSDASTKAFAAIGETVEPGVIAITGAVTSAAEAISELSDNERKWLVIAAGTAAIVMPAAVAVKVLKDAHMTLGVMREAAAVAAAKNTAATTAETAAVVAETAALKVNTGAWSSIVADSAHWKSMVILNEKNFVRQLASSAAADKISLTTRAVDFFKSSVSKLPSATSIGIAAIGAFALEYKHLKDEIKSAQDAMNHLNDSIPQRSKETLKTPFNAGEEEKLKKYITTIKDERRAAYDAVREVLESRFGPTAVEDALHKNGQKITRAARDLEKLKLHRGTGVYKDEYYSDEALKGVQDQKFAELRRLTDLVKNKQAELTSRQKATTAANAPSSEQIEAIKYANAELAKMRRELYLNGDASALAAMKWEVLNGKYKEAPEAIKKQLLLKAEEIDLQKEFRDILKETADERDRIAKDQKRIAEEQNRIIDGYVGHHAEKLKEMLGNMRTWAREAADAMKSFADETITTVKEQVKKEQEERDKALDEARSRYEKLSEIGAAGAAAVTNIVMFGKKTEEDREPTLADFTDEAIQAAAKTVRENRSEEQQILSRVRENLYGNAIGDFEAYSKQQTPDLYGQTNQQQVNILTELVKVAISQLNELKTLNQPQLTSTGMR